MDILAPEMFILTLKIYILPPEMYILVLKMYILATKMYLLAPKMDKSLPFEKSVSLIFVIKNPFECLLYILSFKQL